MRTILCMIAIIGALLLGLGCGYRVAKDELYVSIFGPNHGVQVSRLVKFCQYFVPKYPDPQR